MTIRAVCIFLSATFLFACSSDDTNQGTPDSQTGDETDTQPDADAPEAGYPAFTIDAPQVLNLGGPVLNTPKVQPVFFPGFDFATQLTEFTSKIGASSYWAALSEYKVGALTSATPIALTSAQIVPGDIGNISDGYIQQWLISRFDGTHPEFGTTPDTNTIYTLFYPSATVISLGGFTPDGGVPDGGSTGGSKSCQSFGGYHGDVLIGGTIVAYAVLPECPTFGAFVGVNAVTAATSHELSEASTDPYPVETPAFSQVDDDHIGWEFFLGGGEIGDMCAQFPSSFYTPSDFAFVVQRNWSNASAKAGHDPCVPAPATPAYFNAMPILTDSIMSHGATTKGVTVPVGQSKTIELDLFSDAPLNTTFTVSAAAYGRGGAAVPITLAFDTGKGNNGDKLNLTIKSTGALTGSTKTATLVVTSTFGTRENLWLGLIGQ